MVSDATIFALSDGGGHVIMVGGTEVIVRTRSGKLFRTRGVPANMLTAIRNPSDSRRDACDYVRSLEVEMHERNAAYAQARWPELRRRVFLTGTGGVIEDVAAALEAWRLTPIRFDSFEDLLASHAVADSMSHHEPALLVSYAEPAAERAHWSESEADLSSGVAWLRAYREHEVCFVEPVTLTEQDPGPTQVARRRIAASIHPNAMAVWLEQAPSSPTMPDPYARSMIVGRILTVALAWAQETADLTVYRRTLWKLVPSTASVSEHTLLSYEQPYASDSSKTSP